MRKVMEEDLAVFSTLKKFGRKKLIDFHMPGHKGGLKIPSYLKRSLYRVDTTELFYSDDLNDPKGMLADLLIDISEEYESEKSYILCNGATQGIHSAIYGCLSKNEKIIVDRDCHISVLNALAFSQAVPVFTENIPKAIEGNSDAKAVFFTYPDYYGVCKDAAKIIKASHDSGMTVIVDESHGAHLHFNDKLPASSIRLGADIVIHSMHKTLPVLTQTGMLHIKDRKSIPEVGKTVRMFGTTSPSYVLMVSCEFGFRYMQKSGKIELDRIIKEANEIKGFSNIIRIKNDDPTRLVFDITSTGYTGFELSKRLYEDHGIVIEMADLDRIVLIASVMNRNREFKRLKKALEALNCDVKVNCEKETETDLSDAGKISENNLILYPPGTPVILKGEKLTVDKLDYIEKVKKEGGEIIEC